MVDKNNKKNEPFENVSIYDNNLDDNGFCKIEHKWNNAVENGFQVISLNENDL